MTSIQRVIGVSLACGLLASIVAVPSALAETARDQDEGGAYVSVSGGLTHPLGQTDIQGSLSAGTVAIPFVGSATFKTGWDGRLALGYEELVDVDEGADALDHRVPRYRVEVEGLMLRAKRASFTAGALNVVPNDQLSANVLFANGYLHLLGKGTARLWAGAGIGYASVSLPDARQIASCSCLGPAEGSGLAYQGKVVAEVRLAPSLLLVTEGAYVNLPGLSTAERPVPVATYAKTRAVTTNVGFRLKF